MEVSKTDLGLEYTAEVGTDCGPIRTAVEYPTYEILPARHSSSECFLVRFVLARPGEYQRTTILEHGREVFAVYAQTVGWTPTVRVKAQEGRTAVGLGDSFAQIAEEIDPVQSDGEAKVGVPR